jgi:long-subunit acyl-CoA synthetase (AMP-forming)
MTSTESSAGERSDVQATAARLDAAVAGQTFASRWLRTVAELGARVALRARDGEAWVEYTYDEVADRVAQAAAGLRALGVGPGDRVVLMMRNIPEFHIVDLAVVFCGATPVSIYNSSPPTRSPTWPVTATPRWPWWRTPASSSASPSCVTSSRS